MSALLLGRLCVGQPVASDCEERPHLKIPLSVSAQWVFRSLPACTWYNGTSCGTSWYRQAAVLPSCSAAGGLPTPTVADHLCAQHALKGETLPTLCSYERWFHIPTLIGPLAGIMSGFGLIPVFIILSCFRSDTSCL